MQANITLTTTDTSAKKVTTTISYVNVEATNQQLKSLAITLNNFTTNEFVQAVKVVKGDVL